MASDLNYDVVGGTQVAAPLWSARPVGYRRHERTVDVGSDDRWEPLSEAVLGWAVKTRSGFAVKPQNGESPAVRPGAEFVLVAHLGVASVVEPVRVIEVVTTDGRCGFSYGTRSGHPVRGEEAFVIHRSAGRVFLTLRSLTRAGDGFWRAAYPAALVAQRWYRWRYLRALRR